MHVAVVLYNPTVFFSQEKKSDTHQLHPDVSIINNTMMHSTNQVTASAFHLSHIVTKDWCLHRPSKTNSSPPLSLPPHPPFLLPLRAEKCCDRVVVKASGSAKRDQSLYLGTYRKVSTYNGHFAYRLQGKEQLYIYYYSSPVSSQPTTRS